MQAYISIFDIFFAFNTNALFYVGEVVISMRKTTNAYGSLLNEKKATKYVF